MSMCVIVGGGEFDGIDELPGERDLLIAADKGYEYLEKLGLKPDVIVGDFDSYGRRPEVQGVEIVTLPVQKDVTDMQAAVNIGEKRGYWNFHIYGGGGGRPDHTMANIQLITYLAECRKFGYIHYKNTIMTVIRNSQFNFSNNNEGYVSVFSLSEVSNGVSIKGLKYELENERLNNAYPLGVSNEFVGRPAYVDVRDGTLLLIWDKQQAAEGKRQ
ncbi:MAG: thiamine diphosphokinase [Lachnospiraceae bacterium]|nr:thiamine diphosphokinase [Lachnospiraceae bacterium]